MKSSRFSTILAIRGKDGRPSDLEYLLRDHCQKLRVVHSLEGGAQLLITKALKGRAGSLALQMVSSTSSTMIQKDFFDSYQMAIVFVTLPGRAMDSMFILDHPNSVFHQLQTMARASLLASQGEKLARVCLVGDATEALEMILSLTESLLADMQAQMHQMRLHQMKYFVPNHLANFPNQSQQCAAMHVSEALRQWAERFEMPPSEINVLMNLLGTAGNIVAAQKLDSIPMEDRSRRLVKAFFAGEVNVTPPPNTRGGIHTYNPYSSPTRHVLPEGALGTTPMSLLTDSVAESRQVVDSHHPFTRMVPAWQHPYYSNHIHGTSSATRRNQHPEGTLYSNPSWIQPPATGGCSGPLGLPPEPHFVPPSFLNRPYTGEHPSLQHQGLSRFAPGRH